MAGAPGIAPSRGVLETLQVTGPSAPFGKMDDGSGIAPLKAPGCNRPDSLASSPSMKGLVGPQGFAPWHDGLKGRCAPVTPWTGGARAGNRTPISALARRRVGYCTTHAKGKWQPVRESHPRLLLEKEPSCS